MECTFCGITMERGTGLMYVQIDGKILYFCSRKCEKNLLKLKRKGREQKWTATYRQEKQQKAKNKK